MSNKRSIPFGVVGCGHIGKRHAEMIRQNPSAELVAWCDVRSPEEAGIPKDSKVPFYNSMEEMLEKHPEIEVVNICTPNGLHAAQATYALKNNRHVVCEKPMGLSAANCERVISLALEKSKQVFCVMQNRYSPPSVWIKDVIDRKLLGEIYMVQLNCFWNRDERYYRPGGKQGWKGRQDLDGGTLYTQFSHFIDIMYWLFGDITDIHGSFADFTHPDSTDFEDSGIVQFRFHEGGMGTLQYSTAVWDSNFESSLTIIGSQGTVKIGGQYMGEVTHCHIKDYEMPELDAPLPPNDYGSYKGSAANHHFVIENVVDTLNGLTSVTTNAMEGMKVVDIIERIYAVRNKSFNKEKQSSYA
ncbi:MAG: Gfo/Idh/MocA family oxidoreductase [Flavobacteriales bacterium]|nr:Gfo/Idh/MocA family oxidoreductase [Flavobacteriales bacterium]